MSNPSNRETYTVKTPVSNQEVVLKTYITGREKRALVNIFLSGDVSFDAAGKNVSGLKGDLVDKAENLALATVVVSVDGKADNVVDAILDMNYADYAFVKAEVEKITADKRFEEKKTS